MITLSHNFKLRTQRLAAGIQEMDLQGLAGQRYYLATPKRQPTRHVMVLVHGIARHARLLIESFWPLVQDRGITLVAPLFSPTQHCDYQRLGRTGKGPRSDLMVNTMLAEVSSLTGWSDRKAFFFGHSAGAQFAQRYMFAHPQQVQRAALSAAGCYTFPGDFKYPSGTRLKGELPGVHFEPARFLRVPTAVFIGLEDTVRDESLNCSSRVDRLQGFNRLERARNWVHAMQVAARDSGLQPRTELFEIAGIDHDYMHAVKLSHLNQRVLTWFFS